MLTIACVLKSGGDFTVNDVERLGAGLQDHVNSEFRFCCLTDNPAEIPSTVGEAIPLQYGWPGWWSKMELFCLPGPVLYLDLDTVLLGAIDRLCSEVLLLEDSVLMARDFYHHNESSTILGWNRDLSRLTDKFAVFANNADFHPRSHGIGCAGYAGDQEYIREWLHRVRIPVLFAQDVLSGIYSYKADVRPAGKVPADASIICFHGSPRPWEVNLESLR